MIVIQLEIRALQVISGPPAGSDRRRHGPGAVPGTARDSDPGPAFNAVTVTQASNRARRPRPGAVPSGRGRHLMITD